jgi:hypothetical protein
LNYKVLIFSFLSPLSRSLARSVSPSCRGLSLRSSCRNATTRTARARACRLRVLPDRLLLQLGTPRLARVRVGPDPLPPFLEPRQLAADEPEAGLHGLDRLVGFLLDECRADKLEDAVVRVQGLQLLFEREKIGVESEAVGVEKERKGKGRGAVSRSFLPSPLSFFLSC